MREAINQRRSIRSYSDQALTSREIEAIQSILNDVHNIQAPFKTTIRTFFLTQSKTGQKETIGTYGFIQNAPAFFGGVTKNDFYSLIDFGYLFEWIILSLTKLGLGTVWLGGTFHRAQFKDYITEDEIIPAILAVGYPENMSIKEKIIRMAAQANQRKPFDEIIQSSSEIKSFLESPWFKRIEPAFEAIRIAPSASNKQPWRLIINSNDIHFYLEHTPRYGEKLGFDIQYLDMGIALLHFEIGLSDLNIKYTRQYFKNEMNRDGFEYIFTYRLDYH